MLSKLGHLVSLVIFGVVFTVFSSTLTITAQTTEVEIWSWRSQDAELWTQVEERLKSEGIPVSINFRSFLATEYDSKLNLALAGGTGPDIVYSRRLPGVRTQSLINARLLIPLDGKVDFSNFTSSVLKYIQSGGSTYGVPFAVQVVGIFYNKDLYNEYGLSEPKTWTELVGNAEILQQNGITPFFIPGKDAWALVMQHAMSGVSLLGPDWIESLTKGEVNFLNPHWIELNRKLNALKKYYQPGFLANTVAEQDATFAFGTAAMVFYGIWGYQTWKQFNPDVSVGYFMVPPDDPGKEPWAYVYMDGALGLTSNSKNPDMALEVLKFTATPEFGTIFADVTFNPPAVGGAELPADPLFEEVVEVSQKKASPWVYWVGSVFVTGKPSLYDDVLSPGMQAMYAGKITPEEFAKEAQDAISQWYEPLKGKR